MHALLNATDVRNHFSEFIDTVVRCRPAFVKRNRDVIAALSREQLQTIVEPFRFTLQYEQEDDGSFSGALQEIDLVANAPSLDALKEALARELVEYSQEYLESYPAYSRAPNRRSHLPYVLHVLLQDDLVSVTRLIDA